ncbi:MAG: hypothetical protein JOZ44_13080 [Acidobacteria bacterium]|nr:hypothetical protein [Acidobacteriota bacterium]
MFRRTGSSFCLQILVFAAFAVAGFAQQSSPPAPQKQKGQGDIGVQIQPASPPAEKKISPEEARQLFASIDETLAWLSKDTGFPVKKKVQGELASREQVAKYVDERMSEDEDAKRLQRSEIVLKKFGLLPRDFDLHSFLVELLKEQVAGYYDVKTKKMYLLDWLSADAQKPVLAHELTHALQDQNFDLKTWESPKQAKGQDKEQFTYDEDEAETARSAVAEGQGMVTLIDYTIRDTGHTLADAPQVAEMMRAQMSSNKDFPLLEKAPLMIRESLVFPYGDGLAFESALLQRSKETAFSGAFRRPPQDTHEILDIDAYMASKPVQWLVIPDLTKEIGSGYEKYDVGSIGQLDTRILTEQYADEELAKKMALAWRGGAYYAAGNKDAKLSGTAKVALLYFSRWDSDESADEFARLYAEYIPQRYTKATKLNAREQKSAFCSANGCENSYFFDTNEGPIAIQRVDGPGVLVTEGFNAEVTNKVGQKVLTANPAKSIQVEMRSLMSPLRTSAVLQQALAGIMRARAIQAASAVHP